MLKRSLRIGGGILLVLVGLIGFVLPIMPGWPFFLPGLALLSTEFVWARKLRERLRFRKQTDPPRC